MELGKIVKVGSCAIGCDWALSDNDYAVIEAGDGDDWKCIVNERISPDSHIYHYPLGYIEKVSKFEVDDWSWIYNAVNFKAGLIDVNPLEYRDKWTEKLKAVDWRNEPYFYLNRQNKHYKKRFYHIVYNVEALKKGFENVDIERISKFHHCRASEDDFNEVLLEIVSL